MRTFGILLLLTVLTTTAVAQHGTAGSGMWPMGYSGDTWSGIVTAVNPDTREITLTYHGKKGDETFTGVLVPHYARSAKDGSGMEVQMKQIPTGVYMTAYYMQKTKKVDGKKIKYSEIFDFEWSPTPPKK